MTLHPNRDALRRLVRKLQTNLLTRALLIGDQQSQKALRRRRSA